MKTFIISAPRASATTLAAGDFVKLSSGLVVKCDTNEENVFGVVAATPATDSERVSVIREGLVELRAFVADTDGVAGYDSPIVFGDKLFLGGDAGATEGAGQYAVSGAGTNPVTANEIGICVDTDGEAGSTAADTEGNLWVHFRPGPVV